MSLNSKNNSKIYTAALVGTGHIGFSLGFDKKREQPASHTMALLGNKRIKLIAAADTDSEHLADWKKFVKGAETFSSSEEMYNEIPTPDIITVAVNEDSHMKECLAAIEAKPRLIILEKPVALNSIQAAEIAEAADKAGVPVMVNHERRFAADYNMAKTYLKNIGTLQSVRGELYSGLRIYGKEFENDGAYSLLHDGTHLVDIISWLLDEKLSKPLVTGIFKDDKDVVRNFSAHFSTPSCAVVTISMSGRSRFFSFGLDILGTEGRICLGNGYAKFYRRKESKLYTGFFSLSKDRSIHLPKKTGYFSNMIQNAVDFLDKKEKLLSSLSAAIEDLKVLEEIKAKFI
ncbi:Gfo/Idh/MocA family protein [Treponema bryantii]|uniref:Gfo/Idh/MocA family protein n=1 Tax=Treponema bryantii TaxID=163 RepID=UPI002B317D16|nr:oxidoreductase [Treponema bryantii]